MLPILTTLSLMGFASGNPTPVLPTPAPAAVIAARQDRDPNTCAAYAEWLAETQMLVPRNGVVPLTLFSTVSSGVGSRCGAPITFGVSFFDGNGAIVCSGTVDLAPQRSGTVTYTNLEVRPANIYEFLRWVNGPPATSQQWGRVACISADGRTEAQATDFERMQTLRLHAIVPGNAGAGIAEVRMILQP